MPRRDDIDPTDDTITPFWLPKAISAELEKQRQFREDTRASLDKIQWANEKTADHLARLNGRVGKTEAALEMAQQALIKNQNDIQAHKGDHATAMEVNSRWRARVWPFIMIVAILVIALLLLNGPQLASHVAPAH